VHGQSALLLAGGVIARWPDGLACGQRKRSGHPPPERAMPDVLSPATQGGAPPK